MKEREWLKNKINTLSDSRVIEKITDWAKKRYLPPEITSAPGYWRVDYAPYLNEILDCLLPDSGIEEIAFMKPSQVGATTSLAENWLGYIIDRHPAPTLFLIATEDVAKTSMEIYLDRMIESAGISHKIIAKTLKGKGKRSGRTVNRIEFPGGFILVYGGQSKNALIRYSVQNVIIDEIDKLKLIDKNDDPVALALERQKGFEKSRKTLFLGTPELVNGNIHQLYVSGDQRKYLVPCPFCSFEQELVFRGRRDDQQVYGIYFELEQETLIEESVHYICRNCLKKISEIHKQKMIQAGSWKPTSRAVRRRLRSYHLESVVAPAGSYGWRRLVEDYLKCWNNYNQRIYNIEKYKVFVNGARGLPWEERGDSADYEKVITHRRANYSRGEIPNLLADRETGSFIQFLLMTVDVHKDWLGAEIKGWCRDARSYSIDYLKLHGDALNWKSELWNELDDIIMNKIYIADNNLLYNITLTLIDSSYATDVVYNFCNQYVENVYPVQGRDTPVSGAAFSGFSEYKNKLGQIAYNINTRRYKDRLAAKLRLERKHDDHQPWGYVNFPADYGDDLFREYEAEHLVKKRYKSSGRTTYIWKKKDEHLPNHFWDCGVYQEAALEMLCMFVNRAEKGHAELDWEWFWEFVIENQYFIYEKK